MSRPVSPTGGATGRRARVLAGGWSALAIAGASLVTLFILLPLSRLGVDPHHDGLLFKGALDVLNGQVPFRDSYAQYGAALPVVQAVFLAVFGPTVLVLKGSAVAFYAVTAGLLIALWRSIVPLGLAVVAWALWLAAQPEVTDTTITYEWSGIFLAWSSVYALATSVAACLLLVIAAWSPKWFTAATIASGLVAAVTVHLRTPTGLAVAVGLVIGLFIWPSLDWKRARRGAALFLAGFVALNIVIVGWLALAGALGDWWRQAIVWPSEWSGQHGSALAYLTSFFEARLLPVIPLTLACAAALSLIALGWSALLDRLPIPSRAQIVLPVGAWAVVTALAWLFAWGWLRTWFTLERVVLSSVVLALALALVAVAWAVWRACAGCQGTAASAVARALLPGAVPLIAFFAAASLVQVYPIGDARHIYWAATPALGLLTWFLYRAAAMRAALVVCLAVTVFMPAVVASVSNARVRAGNFTEEVRHSPERLDGIRVTGAFNVRYGGLIGSLLNQYDARPDAPIVGTTREPLWLTLGENTANAENTFMRFGAFPPTPPTVASTAAFVARERPLVLIENWPGSPLQLDLSPYREFVGYRVVHAPGPPPAAAIWLLAPGERVKRPPYRCPGDMPACAPGPAIPGLIFGG